MCADPDLDTLNAPKTSGRTTWPVAVVLIAALVFVAWLGRLLVDDAFISFRYARHLTEGAGLVYNAGERVEGYTNFLWVLLIAGGMFLGFEPGTFSQVLGLACYAGTLAACWRMSQRLFADARWSAAVIVLIGTQYTVVSFATGGLETSLQTFLLASGCAVVVGRSVAGMWRPRDLLTLSLVCSAGMLTRMDFALFAVVLIAVAYRRSRPAKNGPSSWSANGPVRAATMVLPAMLIVGAWLLWKWTYYGSILPNTYYAKAPGPDAVRLGLKYIWTFVASYLYVVPIAFVVAGVVQLTRSRHVLLVAPIIIALWAAYLIRMGGGFIEFRFLAPIMPLFMVTLVWSLRWIVDRYRPARASFLHVIVIAWTMVGSVRHWQTYTWHADRPEPVFQLAHQVGSARWVASGKALHALFPDGDVVIATSAAGALPYYAQLPTIDVLGLNDWHVAHEGKRISSRPGHQRLATVEYLRERGVNLMIGHPQPFDRRAVEYFADRYLADFARSRQVPPGSTIVFIPIGDGYVLPAWYMTRHPAVDAAIEAEDWPAVVFGSREE